MFVYCLLTVSNKVILSAVVGSLSCALLLVIAIGITYRIVRSPPTRRSSRHISPITAIEEQIYAQRSAPPPYLEAMATSRPFEEYQRESAARLEQSCAVEGVDDANDTAALVPRNSSDDDLIDANETLQDIGDGDENIVIALGCLSRWQQHPKPPSDSSESSVSAMDTSPNNATVDSDTRPCVADDADTLTRDAPIDMSAGADHSNDSDDRPLIIC